MGMNEFDQLLEDMNQSPASNPFDQMLDQQDTMKQRAIQSSAMVAVDTQPDRRAEVMKLSERYKLAPELVENNFDTLSRKSKIESVQPDKLVRDHRGLSDWLSDPNNMALASDELDKLKDLSETINEQGDFEKLYLALGSGFARINSSVAKIPAMGVDLYTQYAVNPMARALGYAEIGPNEALRNNAVTKLFDNAAEGYAAQVPELSDKVIESALAGDFKKSSRALAFQVAANFPQMALTIGSTMAGAPGVGLAAMGGMSAASEYDEALDKGVDQGAAMANAVIAGSAEAAFERMGTIAILKKWEASIGVKLGKDTARKIMADAGKLLSVSAIQEGLEEAGTSVVQDASKIATGVNPDIGRMEIASNAANAFVLGGAMGGGMVAPSGFAMGAQRSLEMRRAQELQDFYTALGDKTNELKLKKRLPEASQKLIENLTKDGPVENIYVDPKDMQTYFQSKNMDPLEAATLYGFSKEYQEAIETGTDVKIPLAKWTTTMAETEHFQGLKDDVRFSPDGLSVRENQKIEKQLKADLKLIASQEEDSEVGKPEAELTPDQKRVRSARAVKDNVKQQLLALNSPLYGPAEAEQVALLYAKGFNSLGYRSGTDPLELFNRYGLRISLGENGQLKEQFSRDDSAPKKAMIEQQLAEVRRDDSGAIIYDVGNLSALRRVIADSEIIQGTVKRDDEGFAQGFIGGTSTFPEFFKNKGYTKKAALSAIDKQTAGETLTEKQRTILDDLYEGYIDSLNRGAMYQSAAPSELFQSQAAQAVADTFPAEPAPPTFSKLIQVVEQKMGGSADPQQIRAMLKDIKEEEKKWLGLEEFLAGKERVKKQDLLDFLRANEPEIVDVTLGGEIPALSTDDFTINEDVADREIEGLEAVWSFNVPDALADSVEYIDVEELVTDGVRSYEVNFNGNGIGSFKTTTEMLNAIQDKISGDTGQRFGNRASGEVSSTRYSEHTLPGGENYREVLFTLPDKRAAQAEEIIDAASESFEKGKELEQRYGMTYAEALKARFPDNYTSSHFDEKNIVAHTRLADRVDVDGKKVLFIEEIQSDWHQAGRKRGYRGDKELSLPEGMSIVPYEDGKFILQGKDGMKDLDTIGDTEQETMSLYADKYTRPVPDAPFRNDAWVDYAMKRIIRMAAEGGYDRIAWTTGEQQVERYARSTRELDWISFDPEAKTLSGKTSEGRPFSEPATEDKLPSLIGKEAARLVLAKPKERISSDDLGSAIRAGGEHLRLQYDQKMNSFAKKFGKKFGATVGETTLDMDMSGKSLDDAKVHSLDVTDKMRDVALGQGFELFQSGEKKDAPRGAINVKTDRTMEIELFKKADLSTFLHETGHFYLEVLGDLAKDPNANPQLVADYNTAIKELGGTPGGPITVEMHEKWARAFELYLAKGEAPSLELKKAFAHFKVWLLNIYKNLANLNVELTPELKGVMDRLLATDEQLQAAYYDRSPLFKEDAFASMNEETVEKYKGVIDDARREASEALTAKVVEREFKKREAAYKEKRKAVRARIEEEANGLRIYRALSILQKGTLPDGSALPEGTPQIKIDKDSIVQAYGKEFLDRLPRPYVYAKSGGVDFNMAAEMLGFESGDAMLTEMANAQSKKEYIESRTNEEMDILYPDEVMEQFPAEAVKAAHSEGRSKLLRMELELLVQNNLSVFKDAIRRVARRVPTEAEVRAQARQIIAGKRIAEIKPYTFERAEVKSAKEAGIALAKGDIEAAFEHKRRELLNHELFRAANEAIEEHEKALEFFKKFGQKDEDLAKSRDMDLVNAGRAILSEYDIGKSEKTREEILKYMQAYAPESFESISTLIDSVGLKPGNFDEITHEEFSKLNETVRAIWTLSRQAKNIEIDGKKVAREEIKAELVAQIDAIKKPGERLGYDKAVSDWEKTKLRLQGMKAALRRVESWVSAVDGKFGGPFRKYIWQPIADATAIYRSEKVKVLTQLQDSIKQWQKESEITTAPIKSNLGYTFAGKAELMAAILHTGNKSNMEKLLIGRGWGQILEDGTLDTSRWDEFMLSMYRTGVITKADMDFAQRVWDLNESLKPAAQKAHKEMYGFYFNEVTADEIQTPFGNYRGGYVPAITDPTMVEDAAIRQEQEAVLKGNNSFMFPTTGRGFTKSRVEQYHAPLMLDLKLTGSHIDKVLRFIHIEPRVKEVSRIVMDKKFRASLAELDPTIGQDMLVPWLQRAAQQAVSTPSKGWAGKGLDTFARELRKRAGLQAMFFNVTNTFQQVTGYSIAAVRVKPKYLRNAMWRYIQSPKAFADDVNSKSKFMETRTGTQMVDINQTIEEIALNTSKFDDVRSYVQKHGYFMQSAAQNLVDLTVWGGAYEQAVVDGMAEVEAVRFADAAVRETQGSMAPEDISRFEAGSPFVRLFTMFQGYFNMQANLLVTEFVKTARDMGLRKGAGRLFYIYVMGFMIPAWMSELIVKAMGSGIDEDDDEQYLDDLLMSFFTSQFNTATAMFPVVGPAVRSVVAAFNDKPYDDRLSVSPVVQSIERSAQAPMSVYNAIVNDGSKRKAVRDAMSAVGMLTGIPTGIVQRPLSYLADVDEGKADPTGPVDFTRGLISGNPGTPQ